MKVHVHAASVVTYSRHKRKGVAKGVSRNEAMPAQDMCRTEHELCLITIRFQSVKLLGFRFRV